MTAPKWAALLKPCRNLHGHLGARGKLLCPGCWKLASSLLSVGSLWRQGLPVAWDAVCGRCHNELDAAAEGYRWARRCRAQLPHPDDCPRCSHTTAAFEAFPTSYEGYRAAYACPACAHVWDTWWSSDRRLLASDFIAIVGNGA